MDIFFSKQRIVIALIILSVVLGAILVISRVTGRSLTQFVGAGSGRQAALEGVKAFYSVDYREKQDLWAARLCRVGTQPACDFYQNTVAPYIWGEFETSHTVVTVEVSGAEKLTEGIASTRNNAPVQIWQVSVKLSAPWPQGNGETSFPAQVLVVREGSGWKFERLLLKDELAKYNGVQK
jgi:hypothetical protein